jgi:hypothetical protein
MITGRELLCVYAQTGSCASSKGGVVEIQVPSIRAAMVGGGWQTG